jgi:hypothetical protein
LVRKGSRIRLGWGYFRSVEGAMKVRSKRYLVFVHAPDEFPELKGIFKTLKEAVAYRNDNCYLLTAVVSWNGHGPIPSRSEWKLVRRD